MRRIAVDDIQPNLTALIDIVFLLLIFFVVSSSFMRSHQISIELPQAASTERLTEEKSLTLTIDKMGNFHLQQQAIESTQRMALEIRLRELFTGKQELIILADQKTPYQSVVTAIDLAGKIGITQVRFNTQEYTP